MMRDAPCRRGFSLVENLLSLSVISLIVPTVLAVLTLSLDSSRQATQEARSAEVAAYVFHQVHYAWKDDASPLFPFPALVFPEIDPSGELGILFTAQLTPYDADGVFNIGDTDWKLRTNAQSPTGLPHAASPINSTDPMVSSGYVVTLRDTTPTPSPYTTPEVRRLEVEVTHPAGAPASGRKAHRYSRLVRK